MSRQILRGNSEEKAQIMFQFPMSVTRILATAMVFGGVALAGPATAMDAADLAAPPPSSSHHHGKAVGKGGVETRINALHVKLHITGTQEAQWTVVAQAMRDNAKDMDALINERSAAKSMTAIDDLQSYQKLAEAHDNSLKKFIPLFQMLYDGMSDDQKKIADQVFAGHEPGPRHHKKG